MSTGSGPSEPQKCKEFWELSQEMEAEEEAPRGNEDNEEEIEDASDDEMEDAEEEMEEDTDGGEMGNTEDGASEHTDGSQSRCDAPEIQLRGATIRMSNTRHQTQISEDTIQTRATRTRIQKGYNDNSGVQT